MAKGKTTNAKLLKGLETEVAKPQVRITMAMRLMIADYSDRKQMRDAASEIARLEARVLAKVGYAKLRKDAGHTVDAWDWRDIASCAQEAVDAQAKADAAKSALKTTETLVATHGDDCYEAWYAANAPVDIFNADRA